MVSVTVATVSEIGMISPRVAMPVSTAASVGAAKVTGSDAAAAVFSVAVAIVTGAGGVIKVRVPVGGVGYAPSGPERNRSPGIAVSRISIAETPLGGTPDEVNGSVVLPGAFVAVSIGVGEGGLKMAPAIVGSAVEKAAARSRRLTTTV